MHLLLYIGDVVGEIPVVRVVVDVAKAGARKGDMDLDGQQEKIRQAKGNEPSHYTQQVPNLRLELE